MKGIAISSSLKVIIRAREIKVKEATPEQPETAGEDVALAERTDHML